MKNELQHDKTNKMTGSSSEDSDQPHRLISLRCPHEETLEVLSYLLSKQRRLCSDCADVQADLSLRWAHTFCWFCHAAAQIIMSVPKVFSNWLFSLIKLF